MADIKQITLPSGSVYNIKDETARTEIENIKNSVTGAMHYIGITTTAISDGSTTNPITINSKSVTAVAGDVAIYSNKEFVWNGTGWDEFGSTGSLKALAFKDSASGTYTPAGTVTQPTFTGTSFNSTGKFTPSGTVTVSTKSTSNKTAAVSPASSGTVTYTPAGSVTISKGTGTANYTPEGSVSTPTITVTPNTATVNSITNVGSLPSWTASVENENLTIGWSQGALPTKGGNQTVVTGIKSASSSQPEFTGTGAELKGSFTGTGVRLVTGNIPVPSAYTASFEGTEGDVSVSGKATGTVSKPTFTGTQATITVS